MNKISKIINKIIQLIFILNKIMAFLIIKCNQIFKFDWTYCNHAWDGPYKRAKMLYIYIYIVILRMLLSKATYNLGIHEVINLEENFMTDKTLVAVCKFDWQKVRSHLFFNVQTFCTNISDSVCNDLYKLLCIDTIPEVAKTKVSPS